MREIKQILGNNVLIKKVDNSKTIASGLKIRDDGESLPVAKVVMISSVLSSIGEFPVKEGDLVHYTKARESGKCEHNGETHYVMQVDNLVAIL